MPHDVCDLAPRGTPWRRVDQRRNPDRKEPPPKRGFFSKYGALDRVRLSAEGRS